MASAPLQQCHFSASLHDLRADCKQKYNYINAQVKIFRKKVTKKGSHVNKKRQFVDKTPFPVGEGGYLCGCLRY